MTAGDGPAPKTRGAIDASLSLAPAALVAALVLSAGPRLYDDAFISLRYAANLAAGEGLVFNAGERVLGTSTPLWAVLLGLVGAATGAERLPVVAFAIGAAALFGVSAIAWALLRPSCGRLVSVLAVSAALTPLESARVFASGMETPLYLLLVSAALLLVARRRDAAAFLAAGALPFVHPEGALLFPALAVAVRQRDGRWPVRAALPGAAAAIAFAAVLTAWFGSPVPQSLRAKQSGLVEPPLSALDDLSDAVLEAVVPPRAPGLLQHRSPAAAVAWEAGLPAAAAALLAALAWYGRRALARPEVAAAALFGGAYLAAFAAGNPLVFPWYEPPLLLAFAVVVGAVAGEAGRGAARARAIRRLAVTLLAAGSVLRIASLEPYGTDDREELYRAAALEMKASPQDVVLAPEIGALGFYSKARIWDSSGLVTPEALRFRGEEWRGRESGPRALGGGTVPVWGIWEFGFGGGGWRARESGPRALGGGTVPVGAIEAVRPDWVVALSRFLDPLLRESPGALDGYELVASYPSGRWGSRAVLVYRRRS